MDIATWMQNNTLYVVLIILAIVIGGYKSYEYFVTKKKKKIEIRPIDFSKDQITKQAYLRKMLEYTITELEKIKDEYTISRHKYDEYDELVKKMNTLQNNIMQLEKYKLILYNQIEKQKGG
jgi:hypothetical protein